MDPHKTERSLEDIIVNSEQEKEVDQSGREYYFIKFLEKQENHQKFLEYSKNCKIYIWEETEDKRILKIFEEEAQKLGLEHSEIYVMVPEDPYDVDDITSCVCSCGNHKYEIHLHPKHSWSSRDIRETLRHELFHIYNGDLERFSSLPLWLGKPLRKLYQILIGEALAEKYAKGF